VLTEGIQQVVAKRSESSFPSPFTFCSQFAAVCRESYDICMTGLSHDGTDREVSLHLEVSQSESSSPFLSANIPVCTQDIPFDGKLLKIDAKSRSLEHPEPCMEPCSVDGGTLAVLLIQSRLASVVDGCSEQLGMPRLLGVPLLVGRFRKRGWHEESVRVWRQEYVRRSTWHSRVE
jgi:hypothetical protein